MQMTRSAHVVLVFSLLVFGFSTVSWSDDTSVSDDTSKTETATIAEKATEEIPDDPAITSEETIRIPVEGIEELALFTSAGTIEVSGDEDAEEIVVTVIKQAKGDEEIARACLEAMDIQPVEEEGICTLELKWKEEKKSDWQGMADYRVALPADIKLTADTGLGEVDINDLKADVNGRTSHGPISVSNIKGSCTLVTNHGTVNAENIDGPLDAKTGNGKVTVADAKECILQSSFGSIEASGIEGSLEMKSSNGTLSASDVTGNVTIDCGHGPLSIEKIVGEVTAKTNNGVIEVTDVAGPMKIESGHGAITADLSSIESPAGTFKTNNGEIKLKLGSKSSMILECTTAHEGEISTGELPFSGVEADANHFKGQLGDGESKLEVQTGFGPITISS